MILLIYLLGCFGAYYNFKLVFSLLHKPWSETDRKIAIMFSVMSYASILFGWIAYVWELIERKHKKP